MDRDDEHDSLAPDASVASPTGPRVGPDAGPEVGPQVEAVEDDELLPGHATTVIVPVANPATARDLLRLAIALCEVGGTVIALSIALDDARTEATKSLSERLRSEVDEIIGRSWGRTVELVARPAPSVARGILEVTRESGADMLVLGIPHADDDGSLLGSVADSIIDIAPCDVVLVRPGRVGDAIIDTERIVVTVDDDDSARTAARTGVLVGDGLHQPVQAVHVQDAGRPPWDGFAVIARSLHGVEGARDVDQRLLRGHNVADAVLRHCREHDLLVVGLHRETGIHRWLFGSVVTDLLRRSSGPVVVVARRTGADRDLSTVRRIGEWLRPRLTDVEQETLLWQARRDAGTTIDYLTLLTLSAVLATLGLVQDSTAVIIGAMLVAPLLGPLSAMSLGLVTARTPLLRRAALTILTGTAAAIAVAGIVGWVVPVSAPTSQMLLRGAPSLLDVGVAMASGLVGAYATARKDIPAALAGVAIAAALVPPLGTVGLGIGLADAGLAVGALLLFLVNVSSVLVTGAIAFWWFGVHPVEQDRATRRRIVSALLAAGLVLLVVTALVLLLQESRRAGVAEQEVRDLLAVADDVEVVSVEVEDGADPVVVTATVRTGDEMASDELQALEQQVADGLGRPVALRVVELRVVTPETVDDG